MLILLIVPVIKPSYFDPDMIVANPRTYWIRPLANHFRNMKKDAVALRIKVSVTIILATIGGVSLNISPVVIQKWSPWGTCPVVRNGILGDPSKPRAIQSK
jgi:hypothetical protein